MPHGPEALRHATLRDAAWALAGVRCAMALLRECAETPLQHSLLDAIKGELARAERALRCLG